MGTRHKHDAERISTHAPAGGATLTATFALSMLVLFLLTPLREGRRPFCRVCHKAPGYFYSRPCGRGDSRGTRAMAQPSINFYSRPCGRGDTLQSR